MNCCKGYAVPYASFTLTATKDTAEKSIKWEGIINDNLIAVGTWHLQIKSIALTGISKTTMPDNASLTDSPVFSLTCNLTGNNIRWFGPIIQNYSSKQPYISLYPIEYFQIKALKSKKEHVQTFEMNGQPQLLNVVQKNIAIEMKPMEETYKFDDISCKASVHVNLYKA